jgi:hypothetical protein
VETFEEKLGKANVVQESGIGRGVCLFPTPLQYKSSMDDHKAVIDFFTVSPLLNTPSFHRGNCKNKSIFINETIFLFCL